MKKALFTVICTAAVLSLTACNSTNTSTNSSAMESTASTSANFSQNQTSTVSTNANAPAESSTAPESSAQSEPSVPAPEEPDPETPKATYAFQREDGGVEILNGGDEGTEVTIPDTINDMAVVGIKGRPNMTYFPNAKTITLPKTLRDIDDYAFSGCSELTEITIPPSVEDIGEYAFLNCEKLTSITFSEGLEEISTGAFSGCTSLKKITLPNSLQELEQGAFDYDADITVTYQGKSYTQENIGDLYALLYDY